MNTLLRLALGAACAAPVLACASQTWDLANDFSLNSNPNGVWTYGVLGFTPSTDTYQDSVFKWWGQPGSTPNVGVNWGSMDAYDVTSGHASLECDWASPDARFTAPIAGLYDINLVMGGVTSYENGGTGNAHVDQAGLMINGLDQAYVSYVNNIKSWSLSGVYLNAGDTVDAYMHQAYGSGNTDTTFTIATAAPEPISLIGFGAGTLLLLKRRRH